MSGYTPSSKSASNWVFFSSLLAKLKDVNRWRKSLFDLALWFMVGILLTTAGSIYSPGYPIVVGTESIQPGVYWLDRTDFQFERNSYVTFDFVPNAKWLTDRYGNTRIHTKLVAGIAGDTIKADAQGRLTICRQGAGAQNGIPGAEPSCHSAGAPREFDSAGRPMTRWLGPGQQYTLKPGELWVYGPHPKSLDSRYQGPVTLAAVHGKARPLYIF